MLKSTFIHIQGIGAATERKIWQAGVKTWEDFLRADGLPDLIGGKASWALDQIHESLDHYQQGAWSWFEEVLPARVKWRAFGDFGARKVLYVDIETDGRSEPEGITVIGAYDGKIYQSFIAEENLLQAQEYLEDFPLLVTFNGNLFDMPLIRAFFPYAFWNYVHIDLRFPLRMLGYTGGLKTIEKMCGLERSEKTEGLDGRDAVILWHAWRSGVTDALPLLLRYNSEDVINLKPLMEMTYRDMMLHCGFHRD